jgi:hypothetical protein
MHNIAIYIYIYIYIFTFKTSQLQQVSILERWSSGKNKKKYVWNMNYIKVIIRDTCGYTGVHGSSRNMKKYSMW